jgi:hypothetical protein
MRDMRCDEHHMLRADQKIRSFCDTLRRQYGFVSDPDLPLWRNVVRRIKSMSISDYEKSFINNLACHNLLRESPLPKGTTHLLGLGLNYCLKGHSSTSTTTHTFTRLRQDVRRMFHLSDCTDDSDYIPSLYIRSSYQFDAASPDIERALSRFERSLKLNQELFAKKRKSIRNLSYGQYKLMRYFKDNDRYIVVQGDKNLGPCILDRRYYIHRGCLDHLSNTRNYRQLTHHEARIHQTGLIYKLNSWLMRYRPRFYQDIDNPLPPREDAYFSQAEATFLQRAFARDPYKLAKFRMICKVHKSPWQTRPIVCCSGTILNELSRWLDFWLQKLRPKIPSFVKDSQQVLDEVSTLRLPPNAKLFTTDANAMYNNIDTNHAISVISTWLDELYSLRELPRNFPLEAVKEAMRLVMRNNLFEWGDLCFLQLLGTAMGTSAAVMWATIYYATHENNVILPKYRNQLLYFRRYIDDIFGIWIGETAEQWHSFCNDIDNFGILTWDIRNQRPSNSVDFLDLTLTIEGSRVTSRTYQKHMNLYLYLPPTSAHPPGVIKGMVFGLIRRFHAQNTHRSDYLHMVRLLYRRLIQRGWHRDQLRPLILDICSKLDRRNDPPTPPLRTAATQNQLFIHLTYHPDDLPRQHIRALYDKHLGAILQEELDVTRPIIAYSRSKNIGEYVTKAKLHQAPGQTTSLVMGELRETLNPSSTPPTNTLHHPTLPQNQNPNPSQTPHL